MFNNERHAKQYELVKEFYKKKNPSRKEKDLFNLQCMIYEIMPGSLSWRLGRIATLKRAIKRLEEESE